MPVAPPTDAWTLAMLDALPHDGNKYELVRGELFVTPAPSESHEWILARLRRRLDRYVEAQGLGVVFGPRAVVRVGESEVRPDLMVRAGTGPAGGWEKAPVAGRAVTIVRRGHADVVEREAVRWNPAGASEALVVRLVEVFGEG
jgi:hypothetical protein